MVCTYLFENVFLLIFKMNKKFEMQGQQLRDRLYYTEENIHSKCQISTSATLM